MESIKYHPVCKLFPAMSGDEQDALTADIEANGLREPIVTYQGLLVDGRHRLAGCRIAQVEPRFVEWDGAGSLVAFVASKNQHRRHLTESQRAVCGLRIREELEREAAAAETAPEPDNAVSETEKPHKTSDSELSDGPSPNSPAPKKKAGRPKKRKTKEAAALAGTTERAIERAAQVEQADPQLLAAVESGEISIHAAEQRIAPPKYNRADDSTLARAECRDACDVIREHLPRIEGIDHAKGLERLGQLAAVVDGKKRMAKKPADIPATVDPAQVEALLEAYPRRIDPHDARKAIGKALLIESFDVLMEAVKAFAASPAGNAGVHTKHPATWFNKRSWLSDRAEWFRGESGPAKKTDAAAATRKRNLEIMGLGGDA